MVPGVKQLDTAVFIQTRDLDDLDAPNNYLLSLQSYGPWWPAREGNPSSWYTFSVAGNDSLLTQRIERKTWRRNRVGHHLPNDSSCKCSQNVCVCKFVKAHVREWNFHVQKFSRTLQTKECLLPIFFTIQINQNSVAGPPPCRGQRAWVTRWPLELYRREH